MIFLCEFEVHDGTSISKLYVGTHGTRSGSTDTPANQYYEPRLASVGRVERSMFGSGDGVSSGTTGGQSEVGFGNISVLNGTPYGASDLIDHWKNLAFRSVTIKSLTGESQSFALAVTRFVGTIENLVSTNALERYDLIIHDRLEDFDKPLLTSVYEGTTNFGGDGTVEGDTDLTDQVKQKIWGTVHNVAAISVNPFDLVWQVSDGVVSSIVVYDGGVALTFAGNVGSLPALFATGVAAGYYLTCTSLGLFILGSPPIGTVTADVVEGATAAERTAAQIVSRMVEWFQDSYPHLSVSLTSSDVTALDALNSAECGILVQDTESGLEAITRVLNSVGAWMLPRSNSTSMFDLGRMDSPSGSAVASYDFEDNIGGNPERVESGDDNRGVPAWKVTVRYDQLATVQSAGDLFGVVTENDPIRVQYLATEWRQASVEDDGILDVWPNAPTLTVDTRLMSQAAAQAEAARLFALYSVQRDIWRIKVPMSADPADDPGIGEVVELTSRNGRMGLGREIGSGDLFRVLGRVDDFDDVPMLELMLLGEPTVVAIAPGVVVRNARLAPTDAADTASITGNVPIIAHEAGCSFHFDGVSGETTTSDSSGNGHTITLTNAVIATAQKKFGPTSLHILSSASLYELDGSADFAFGTGDFTIDFWIIFASTSGTRIIYDSRPTTATTGAYPVIRNVSGTGLQYLVGTTVAITGTGLSFSTWYHIAVTRASGSTRLFIDGVQQGSTYADSNDYIVGASRPNCTAISAYIDDLHVVKGRAEWTANFTPPTVAWTP